MLQRFLTAPNRAHDLIRTSTRNLSIEGRNSGEYVEATLDTIDETETEGDQLSGEPLTLGEQRIVHMCESLIPFTAHLARMNALSSFRLKMLMESPISKPVENLWNKSILALMSSLPKSLTSLTIDNPGVPSRLRPDSDESYHICPLLLAKDILPSLRHLYIRTRSICPKIYKLNDTERKSQLETLIINLSMNKMEMCSAHHACYCTEFQLRKDSLYLHMLDAAKVATVRFPSLRTLRILHHKLPSLEVTSYDVISNKRDVLQEDVRWDDIGWIDDGATDLEFNTQSDVDLFDDSTSETEAPWIDLKVEAAL
jgi:hypothetical protein